MKREDLLIGQYYKGLDRFTKGIGLWTGVDFMGYGYKFGEFVPKSMDYYPEIEYELLNTEDIYV